MPQAAHQMVRSPVHNFSPQSVLQAAEAFGICPRGFRMDEPSVERAWNRNSAVPFSLEENAAKVSRAAEVIDTNFIRVDERDRGTRSDRLADALQQQSLVCFSGHAMLAAVLIGIRLWPGDGGRDGIIGVGSSHPLLQAKPQSHDHQTYTLS